jgi:50S ribosomal protein L16 3-hydroxylase
VIPLQWPDGLNERIFLEQYWQQQPLLIRQAFPGFSTPLPADELAGLSLEEGTTPRLILRRNDGQYGLEHGPFDADRFTSLGDADWSLLITDVEKHLPELGAYLAPFHFLPDWRIDDLMISYAPDGASVGAHVDEYDVFLLQASGTRRWMIDSSGRDQRAVPDAGAGAELSLLANFEATDTMELQPGDLLYLPPGVPHHGVAVGADCTTWSIGCRAPSQADVLVEFAAVLAETLGTQRFRDPPLAPAMAGELTAESIQAFGELWQQATALTSAQLVELTGKLVTRSPGFTIEKSADGARRNVDAPLTRHPFCRFAHVPDGDTAKLFVDGQMYRCSVAFAKAVCAHKDVLIFPAEQFDKADLCVLQVLLDNDYLIAKTDGEATGAFTGEL